PNGCIEGAVFEEAQKVLAAGKRRVVPYGVADDVAFEVGLAGGGHVEVMIQPVTPVHLKLIELIESERPAELRTNLQTGEVQLLERSPDLDAPARDGDWFVEPHRRAPHPVIIGAIHIAIPLHRMAKLLGYRVTVIDARAKFATKERFPEADELLVSWPDEALAGNTLDRST